MKGYNDQMNKIELLIQKLFNLKIIAILHTLTLMLGQLYLEKMERYIKVVI